MKQLPRFAAPPVVETILGIQFSPIERWGVPHFGLYWQRIKSDFPRFEAKPPLASQVEEFEAKPRTLSAVLQLEEAPEIRCWFVSADEHRLVQVQQNRFIYNWRKEESNEAYPHYNESIRPAFERELRRFEAFLAENSLGPLEVIQSEVTYLNHIEIEAGLWQSGEIESVLPFIASPKCEFLPPAEDVSVEARFRMPDNSGRLRVTAKPAIRRRDGKEIIHLTLLARGKPKASDTESALEWLDVGREWVVRGFADFTSKQMHRIWNRTR